MKKTSLLLLLTFLCAYMNAQTVGIGTNKPDSSAALDISSKTSGLLIPRMTTDERTSIKNPAVGLMVFDTKMDSYWLYNSNGWTELATMDDFIGQKSINGNTTFTNFTINPKRYVWEINASITGGNSISIPQNILTNLCADDDGCKVTISMSQWDGTNSTASKTFQFFYAAVNNAAGKREWRTDENNGSGTGVDGDGAVGHAINLFNEVYFTDASYQNNGGTDNALGMNLLKWITYPNSTICRLIMED